MAMATPLRVATSGYNGGGGGTTLPMKIKEVDSLISTQWKKK